MFIRHFVIVQLYKIFISMPKFKPSLFIGLLSNLNEPNGA